jgi:hypothetical protein
VREDDVETSDGTEENRVVDMVRIDVVAGLVFTFLVVVRWGTNAETIPTNEKMLAINVGGNTRMIDL